MDIYKKILVNQFDEKDVEKLNSEEKANDTETSSEQSEAAENKDVLISEENSVIKDQLSGVWKEKMVNNPKAVTYGNGVAEIIDYAVIDEHGKLNPSIYKETDFSIRMKVQFFKDVENPIFAYTLKDIKGTEITGTNTMLERQTLEHVKAGDNIIVDFKQKMCLQGGNYLLALGCTGYESGEFTVYSRLYDICNIEVVSDCNTIGYVDMDAQVSYL